ncbi:hypothetical protein [Kineococcus radiotolerans]|uniref:Uncharacterized protein n=1 Tax=Kineococcus radiotolerans (strain ATCC BAA-149 / DSM 14245 / SRS30216) TaxID=266940 RepID=A6WAH9_KINRD|nr:hypothetical protein [Kineococcus radiotolerans]ABS03818.1 hypothetical protein Krad_2338 [Kineococcus radiotolerans SRS30216 = ATCC BAA-149]
MKQVSTCAETCAVHQQSDALAAWWRQLSPAIRTELVRLPPTAHLPAALAGQLRSFGVDVADIGVTQYVRGQAVTVYAQPRSLLRFLAAARIWVAIKAPPPPALRSALQ